MGCMGTKPRGIESEFDQVAVIVQNEERQWVVVDCEEGQEMKYSEMWCQQSSQWCARDQGSFDAR